MSGNGDEKRRRGGRERRGRGTVGRTRSRVCEVSSLARRPRVLYTPNRRGRSFLSRALVFGDTVILVETEVNVVYSVVDSTHKLLCLNSDDVLSVSG